MINKRSNCNNLWNSSVLKLGVQQALHVPQLLSWPCYYTYLHSESKRILTLSIYVSPARSRIPSWAFFSTRVHSCWCAATPSRLSGTTSSSLDTAASERWWNYQPQRCCWDHPEPSTLWIDHAVNWFQAFWISQQGGEMLIFGLGSGCHMLLADR